MKASLAAGVTSTVELTVDRERTIDFMGEKARVYATPMLVRDIEVACRELLLAHLDPGEDSVGTRDRARPSRRDAARACRSRSRSRSPRSRAAP